MSELESLLLFHVKSARLPMPTLQARLVPERRWRWDMCWEEQKVVCEIDGGTWINGGHNRGAQIESDAEKQNAAAIRGYRTLRVTGNQIRDGRALYWIEQALGV